MTTDEPMRGVIHLGLGVIGVCTFIALMSLFFYATQMVSHDAVYRHLDSVFNDSSPKRILR